MSDCLRLIVTDMSEFLSAADLNTIITQMSEYFCATQLKLVLLNAIPERHLQDVYPTAPKRRPGLLYRAPTGPPITSEVDDQEYSAQFPGPTALESRKSTVSCSHYVRIEIQGRLSSSWMCSTSISA